MPTLASDLRNRLERVVIEARDVAEAGAQAALEALAVHEPKFYPHMAKQQQELRNHLRARARQLGDRQDSSIHHLTGECAYEHWHRMLFARFLAENNLLIEPQENMAISLAEAEELAKEDGVDVWVFASRCAQRMLPQIFRPDDPLLQVFLATEHMLKLEKLLASLPQAVFTASDALGWVYQFWQSKKKDEVNRSEVKIGADEISAVTQLFTEPYMVEFLLHNTLGAWHAGKNLSAEDAKNAETEEELRKKLSLPGVTWDYLRFVREEAGKGEANPQSAIRNPQSRWRPAAGTFDGWPKTAAKLKVLDPYCGSGHFLVAGLHYLVPIRIAEEGLSAREAVDAVLRDNLHGLEIDERCCQIAAFALAFAAWTYPETGGYRPLPDLHVACTGIGPQSTAEEWVNLAEQSGIPMPTVGREAIKNGLLNLHRLFSQAPTLGSLIDPAELPADLIAADYETIHPYLAAILKTEKADDETRERAIAAAGMVKAADLLAGEYHLVVTNVPYLLRRRQDERLLAYIDAHHHEARNDLAICCLERLRSFVAAGSAYAAVLPLNWTFQSTDKTLRRRWLRDQRWQLAGRLGPGAFETISGEVVNVGLFVFRQAPPNPGHLVSMIDALPAKSARAKATLLADAEPLFQPQEALFANADSRVIFGVIPTGLALEEFADCLQGIVTGDDGRLKRVFWECPEVVSPWIGIQGTVPETLEFGGRESLVYWGEHGASVARPQGLKGWRRVGACVNRMSGMCSCLYSGDAFDINVAAIVPYKAEHQAAIWSFCSSPEFRTVIRKLDQKLNVTNATIGKVPFDLDHWQKVAAEKYPDGLPEPESDDPTQWLFHGRPDESTASLQVAVGRLLGCRWPAELNDKMHLSKRSRELVKRCDELAKFADDDGIVCIPSVRGEEPAAGRLEALLAAAGIEPGKVRELAGGTDLDDWLRNGFFQEHCKLFHDRPFVWHIWDGRKRDGFHALVNYHKLCEGPTSAKATAGHKGRKLLESLTYSYLGEWVTRQKDGVKRGEGGAEDRLAAALELQKRLEAILEGEPPYDIFVRWKPLAEQPIGWEPDINDGVRMNIRPFLASDLPDGRTGAGVLRWKPNIKWDKDRGKEPERPKPEYPWFWGWDEKTEDFAGGKTFDGNRHNDCHYTNQAKQAARDAAKGEKHA